MNNWTQQENDIVLEAIEQGINPQHVVEIVMKETKRSKKSIERRLTKMGYLRSCGRNFSSKQGFVS